MRRSRSRGRTACRIVELPPDEFDYSKALNLGIEQVQGELVVSLSAHAIPVDDRWLETRRSLPSTIRPLPASRRRQVPWPDAPWQEVNRLRASFGARPARLHRERRIDGRLQQRRVRDPPRRVARAPFTLPAVEDLDWAGASSPRAGRSSTSPTRPSTTRITRRRARRHGGLIDINRVRRSRRSTSDAAAERCAKPPGSCIATRGRSSGSTSRCGGGSPTSASWLR